MNNFTEEPKDKLNNTNDFPWHAMTSDQDSGLTVALRSDTNASEWWCSKYEGFRYYVHSPKEMLSSTNKFQLQYGELTELLIKPKMTKTEEDLRVYTLKRYIVKHIAADLCVRTCVNGWNRIYKLDFAHPSDDSWLCSSAIIYMRHHKRLLMWKLPSQIWKGVWISNWILIRLLRATSATCVMGRHKLDYESINSEFFSRLNHGKPRTTQIELSQEGNWACVWAAVELLMLGWISISCALCHRRSTTPFL